MSSTIKRVLLPSLIACLLSGCPGSGDQSGSAVPSPPVGELRVAPLATGRAGVLPDFTQLVEAQGPTVVNVVTTRKQPAGPPGLDHRLPDVFRRFIPDLPPDEMDPQRGPQRGLGSGFIISQDGLILTNAHLVAGSSSVIVRLADGKREFQGKVLGADIRSDVALVKIEASGLPVANLGNSANVKPGEWVAAIGSPFGFNNTITAGIVSATNRELPNDPITAFIQTDVAVNPGNSGGPLINLAGQVIGINSMIYSGTGGYMGLSFAIPIEVALDVAKQLQAQGKVTRGSLGVTIQPMTAELARAFRLKSTNGVLVSSVAAGGPAERAGLKSGDVILEYDGQTIDEPADLPRLVAGSPPGRTAGMVIWRDAARRDLQVKVGETRTEQAAEAPAAESTPDDHFELTIGEVPPVMRQQLGIDYGLLVRAVAGPADDMPLRPGDVIIAINQTRFSSAAEFHRLLAGHKAGDTVALLLHRGKDVAYVSVKTPRLAASGKEASSSPASTKSSPSHG
jgi:serine protease Do